MLRQFAAYSRPYLDKMLTIVAFFHSFGEHIIKVSPVFTEPADSMLLLCKLNNCRGGPPATSMSTVRRVFREAELPPPSIGSLSIADAFSAEECERRFLENFQIPDNKVNQ